MLELNEVEQSRKDKIGELREQGIDPFGHSFGDALATAYIAEHFDELGDRTIRARGRVMAVRGHGKACFLVLADMSGRIQLYVRSDDLKEPAYDWFKKYIDSGDIIGVEGTLFVTKTREKTIAVARLWVLSKAIRTLPEKFHGLTDVEIRYRQRYVDLMVNPEVRDAFEKRSRMVSHIRTYLTERGYLEVETPMLQPIAGGATARPFVTHHNALDQDLFLRIAPELYLKRLLVGGFEKVFEINRSFRNEGIDTVHNPEFTMMELYEAYSDLDGMMSLTENLILDLVEKVTSMSQVHMGERLINFTRPFARTTFDEAMQKYAGVSLEELRDDGLARRKIAEFGIHMDKSFEYANVVNEVFDKMVEPNFIDPTFVRDYPVEISPLAKRMAEQPQRVQRFELFAGGIELANAFTELNDPMDQEERFTQQVAAKARGDDESQSMDFDYVRALQYGMPPAGGLGIGIDRLVMLLLGVESIREVILFPQLKRRESQD
ncbi:lysine--tRNA ligase [Candidatus Cryosericum terrychapinii]|uniref:lysine--tRNA ligase n=1 Tax=Candidatus Cryosericum terrychapinii TaxID=2290919 RepID=UPI001A9D3BA7|nr:lysine--tRNA ligase [Candidatus Cryosericum terrychapinii]